MNESFKKLKPVILAGNRFSEGSFLSRLKQMTFFFLQKLFSDQPFARLKRLISEFVFQIEVVRGRPGAGIFHALVFWGIYALWS